MAQLDSTFGALGDRRGNAVVDHIDDAANGATAVAQGSRAAQYFDARGEQRFDRQGVVAAEAGRIQGVELVLQNLDAAGALAAYHWYADAGAERRIADAWLVFQGLAEIGAGAAAQFIAAEAGDGLCCHVGIGMKWRCGNHHLVKAGLGRSSERGKQCRDAQPEAECSGFHAGGPVRAVTSRPQPPRSAGALMAEL